MAEGLSAGRGAEPVGVAQAARTRSETGRKLDHAIPRSEGGPRVPALTRFRVLGRSTVDRCSLLLGMPATLASAIGFCAACAVNYTIQYYWTFAAVGSHGILFTRYALVTLVMLGVNTVFFWLLYSRAGAPYLLAQALATALVFGLNFETNRRYTFKSA